jgi:hypothetical protein
MDAFIDRHKGVISNILIVIMLGLFALLYITQETNWLKYD